MLRIIWVNRPNFEMGLPIRFIGDYLFTFGQNCGENEGTTTISILDFAIWIDCIEGWNNHHDNRGERGIILGERC